VQKPDEFCAEGVADTLGGVMESRKFSALLEGLDMHQIAHKPAWFQLRASCDGETPPAKS
jgi:hypothetical protein